MCEPRTEKITLVVHEHLSLVFQAPECCRMDDPISVALKRTSGLAFGLREQTAATIGRVTRINFERRTLNWRRFEGANMIHTGNLADTMRAGNADRTASAPDIRAIDSEIR